PVRNGQRQRAPKRPTRSLRRGGSVRTRLPLAEGVVTAHRAGYGFVRVEGQAESIFLPPPQMAGLLSGDRVRVSVHRERDGRYSGEVDAILARGLQCFLGTIETRGRSLWVHAVDRRLNLTCLLEPPAEHKSPNVKEGDWVIARVTRYPDVRHAGRVCIESRLDPERPLEMAYAAAIARVGLPVEFPPEVITEAAQQAETLDPKEIASRVDLRDLPLVTIDGEDARDFDDAVFAERDGDGFRLLVAIADVSWYVRPGSALDREARERGTSVYFPQRVLPMLPSRLSDHLCSLAPQVDRWCLTADMRIDRHGKLSGARFYPAVMRSHARLTYSQAYAALFEGQPEARKSLGGLVTDLEPLVALYRLLAKSRRRRGALDFDSSESAFTFDQQGRVTEIGLYTRNDAHRLIEECMILANVAAARELKRVRTQGLYRVHGEPESKKIDLLLSALAALGVDADLPDPIKPLDLRKISERMGRQLDRSFVESLIVRSMQQAAYQPVNIGHFGLALKEYAHFTSPIRRYPDLVVHRALKAALFVKDPSGESFTEEQLSAMGQELSRLEKRADESDRYVDSFLKCCWLRERLGQSFEGLVTTVVEFGCFVQLRGLAIDGLLPLQALCDDDYLQEEGGHAWIGRRSGRRIGIGSVLRVVVTQANPVEGLIDLELEMTSVEKEVVLGPEPKSSRRRRQR
ncbi:MAG: ribonuclease R, partial [Steroidobacteraceae bacterium]